MSNDPTNRPSAEDLLGVLASAASLARRADGLLDLLGREVPFDAAWLALCDPRSREYAGVASVGLDDDAVAFLDDPATTRDMEVAGFDRDRPPRSLADLPVAPRDLPTWDRCLGPAGFHECLGVPLFAPGRLHVGHLTLLYRSGEPPPEVARERLGTLAPAIARGLSPVLSLAVGARIAHDAAAGVVLLRDGTVCALPGLGGHLLLEPVSSVEQLARRALGRGDVFRSFLWPSDGSRGGASSYVRLTVLAATDAPPFVVGTLLVTLAADCQGLTARELEVLGLLVEGLSNHEIADRLVVAQRTVAAHIEHVLHKLDVSTRTPAALRAEREGCSVPAAPPRPAQSRPAPRRPAPSAERVRR